jgi:hypothetical protein
MPPAARLASDRRRASARSAARAWALTVCALVCLGLIQSGRSPLQTGFAASQTRGGINVEPSARPNHYLGANPDSWWCPTAATCTTSDPQGRIDTELGLAEQLHVADIRLEVPWFIVEPNRNQYDWSRADYIFQHAAQHGIAIQPILVYTPTWDGAYNDFPPAADFGSFVSAFMARFGSYIDAIEMWNEPDGGGSLTVNDPAKYTQTILIPGYQAVKASPHPNVPVIEGGSINDAGGSPNWLSGIYNAGGGNSFDIAAFHDYGGNYGQIVQQYQGVLNAHGQGSKPIWLGEYGVSDANGSQQSSLIQAAMTGTPGLAVAQFYTLRDEAVYTCCPVAPTGESKQYGVLTSTYSRKSSYTTMQNLNGGQPAGTPPPAATPPGATGSTPGPGDGGGGVAASGSTSSSASATTSQSRVPQPAASASSSSAASSTPTIVGGATGSPAPTAAPVGTVPGARPIVASPQNLAPAATSRRWLFILLALGGALAVGVSIAGTVLLRRRPRPPS